MSVQIEQKGMVINIKTILLVISFLFLIGCENALYNEPIKIVGKEYVTEFMEESDQKYKYRYKIKIMQKKKGKKKKYTIYYYSNKNYDLGDIIHIGAIWGEKKKE